MPDKRLDPSNRPDAVNEDFAEYLQSVETGRPDRHTLLIRHPELEAILEDSDRLDSLAAPLRELFGEDEPTLPPGTAIGDYEILEQIGRDGQGVVYKVRNVTFPDIVVALKMLLSGPRATEKDVRRFIETTDNLAKLKHKNIVPIYGGGEYEGRLYFTMKLIEGQDLAETAAKRPMSPREAAGLVAKIARAVHYAHQRRLHHRDLKPANVFIDTDGQPYVGDFGLSKRVDSEEPTETGYMVGAPAFIAPEQIDGQTTVLSDVYGLGTILYWSLTGRRPIAGETWEETLQNVRDQKPAPPLTLNSRRTHWLDGYLELICLKCLEKDPQRRYGSAEAFAHDLERWLGYEPPLAIPVPKRDVLRFACRRNPLVAGLVATAAAVLVLAMVAGVAFARAQEEKLRAAIAEISAYAMKNPSQLDPLRALVADAARDAELRNLLREKRWGDLQEFAKNRFAAHQNVHIESWFVVSPDRTIRADWPNKRDVIGRVLPERDYIDWAVNVSETPAGGSTYVGKPYESYNDGLYKIPIAAPVRDGDDPRSRVLGVVAVSFATDSSRAIARQKSLMRELTVWGAIVLSPVLILIAVTVGYQVRRSTWTRAARTQEPVSDEPAGNSPDRAGG